MRLIDLERFESTIACPIRKIFWRETGLNRIRDEFITRRNEIFTGGKTWTRIWKTLASMNPFPE